MVTNQEMQFSLLMDGNRMFDEVLSQAPSLHAVRVADRPPSRLYVLRNVLPTGK
jgi:hypothetical protein